MCFRSGLSPVIRCWLGPRICVAVRNDCDSTDNGDRRRAERLGLSPGGGPECSSPAHGRAGVAWTSRGHSIPCCPSEKLAETWNLGYFSGLSFPAMHQMSSSVCSPREAGAPGPGVDGFLPGVETGFWVSELWHGLCCAHASQISRNVPFHAHLLSAWLTRPVTESTRFGSPKKSSE